jgi:hypothetical protein
MLNEITFLFCTFAIGKLALDISIPNDGNPVGTIIGVIAVVILAIAWCLYLGAILGAVG